MYYESIPQLIVPVASAEEAAAKIKNGQCYSGQALQWSANGRTLLAVSDAHIDDSAFAETAILSLEDDHYFKIESITVAWCTEKQTIDYFKQCETGEFVIHSKTQLLTKNTIEGKKANFTCGCCGRWFNDFVSIQLKFDQDNGYGICPDCKKYYQ